MEASSLFTFSFPFNQNPNRQDGIVHIQGWLARLFQKQLHGYTQHVAMVLKLIKLAFGINCHID